MKYIDADKLIHDLEERIFAYSEGYAEGDDSRKDAIETLLKDIRYQCSLQQEQPEVDLEKETKSWILNECGPSDFSPFADHWCADDIMATARHFAEWQKEKMMKGAVECSATVTKLSDRVWVTPDDEIQFHNATYANFKAGDRVKIIIIPED